MHAYIHSNKHTYKHTYITSPAAMHLALPVIGCNAHTCIIYTYIYIYIYIAAMHLAHVVEVAVRVDAGDGVNDCLY